MNNIKQILLSATEKLKSATPTPRLDAEILLLKILKQNRAFLYAHDDKRLTDIQLAEYNALIDKRFSGVPLAYICKEKEFWSLALTVSSHTLIPRPETECLVEQALLLMEHKPTCRVLELGTGSGAISIALAKEKPSWTILAVEKSLETLAVAKQNIILHGTHNINLLQSDWFSQVPCDETFDLIISNPPYLAEDDPHLLQGDLRFEPQHALKSGETGLDDLSHIISHASQYLNHHGLLMVEHGYMQGLAVRKLFEMHQYQDINTFLDYAGHDRISCGWYIQK